MADRDRWGETLWAEGKGPWPYDGAAERTHAALKRAERKPEPKKEGRP